MPDERSDIFLALLGVFAELGLLSDLILVGSWTHLFFREYLGDPQAVPPIKTTDVDFLVTHPKKERKKVDIPEAIKKLGFLEHYDFVNNTAKYVHDELDLEFLADRIGKGEVNVYDVKPLGIRAHTIRYLSMLQSHVIEVPYRSYTVRVPEPAAYALHKLLINHQRSEKKKTKDMDTVRALSEALLKREHERQRLTQVLAGLPDKWKRKILEAARKETPELHRFLTEDKLPGGAAADGPG
jgi:hypothetical protein